MESNQALLGGTYGKILHVDLTDRSTRVEQPDPSLFQTLVGGRGLISYLLLRDMPAGVDPLSPDNLLIFAPGVLQGSNLPGSGRHSVGGRSPLTGALGSSEVGGWWGHEFKRCGFDALVVHGRAEKPVYLWIHDAEVEIRAADHLWGKETAPTQEAICQELGDEKVRLALIGPAGENMVRFAAVMHDINRAAGRNGMGAVMGSKNLKAVAVRGSQTLEIADRKRLTVVARWLGDNYKVMNAWAVEMGTPGSIDGLGHIGALPTRAFKDPMFEQHAQIGGSHMQETILVDRDTCAACPIRCKQVVKFDDPGGQYNIDPIYGGPEYESLAALGSNCLVDDLVKVAKANERCNAYGLDTMSAGMTISFVMDCVENGLLDAEKTGGFLPQWGDGEAMVAAIEMIAHRSGFGDRMAEGSARLAAEIGDGAAELAMTVKGQELPMHEPRFKTGLGMGYAVAPVGADHIMNADDGLYTFPGGRIERVKTLMEADLQRPEVLDETKVNLFFYESSFNHFYDCAVMCHFYDYTYAHMAEALSAATGVEYSVEEVLAVGERAATLARLFNYREGFSAADDKLPKRVRTAFESGPLAGKSPSDETFAWAIQRYYELMGWNEDGRPSPERLEKLGLSDLLAEIGV